MLDLKKLLTKMIENIAENSKKTGNIQWMCCGAVTGVNVNAGSYADVSITFPSTAPTSAPRVIAMLRSNSTAMNRGQVTPVQSAYSATGTTIRVFNNSTANLTDLVFNWIAMA